MKFVADSDLKSNNKRKIPKFRLNLQLNSNAQRFQPVDQSQQCRKVKGGGGG
eukprot:c14002_g2_i1 orf=404-559(+)